MKANLGDHLDFSNGSGSPVRTSDGDIPVYGANGPIGYATQPNARGPLIVIGRVGSYCGSVRYCDSDVWVTDNAFVCRAKNPLETRYWYYALQTCGLNDHRAGSGSPCSIGRSSVTFRCGPPQRANASGSPDCSAPSMTRLPPTDA